MSRLRAFSSPELAPSEFPESGPSTTRNMEQPVEDVALDGTYTNVKLLLKLIHDHNEASSKSHDDWRTQRVTTMMTILDDVKTRIQKSQPSSRKKELRRCDTDLKPSHQQTPRRPPNEPPIPDDIQRLRRELSASLAARKSLQMMCSSLGKERQIMAAELARKVQELNGMEELINDLRSQNEILMQKVQGCASEHREKKNNGGVGEAQGSNVVLQERNKELSEQLLKSIDGYRSLKRKYRDSQEENVVAREALKDFREEVKVGIQRVNGLKQRVIRTKEEVPMSFEEEILELESLFERLHTKISKNVQKERD